MDQFTPRQNQTNAKQASLPIDIPTRPPNAHWTPTGSTNLCSCCCDKKLPRWLKNRLFFATMDATVNRVKSCLAAGHPPSLCTYLEVQTNLVWWCYRTTTRSAATIYEIPGEPLAKFIICKISRKHRNTWTRWRKSISSPFAITKSSKTQASKDKWKTIKVSSSY